MIRTAQPRALQLRDSDIYQYGAVAIETAYGSGFDSTDATNNWWGDLEGPNPTFAFGDSLGRASLSGYRVDYQPFATAPHFPGVIGSAAGLVATTDTFIGSPPLSGNDSVRVRVVDADGRGVGGASVAWATIPPTGSIITPNFASTGPGGRAGALWRFSTVAGLQVAEAGAGGPPVRFVANVRPTSSREASRPLIEYTPC